MSGTAPDSYWPPHRAVIENMVRSGRCTRADIADVVFGRCGVRPSDEAIERKLRRWGLPCVPRVSGSRIANAAQTVTVTVGPGLVDGGDVLAERLSAATGHARGVDAHATTPAVELPAALPRDLVPPEPPPDHDVAVEDVPRRVLTIGDVHVPIHNPAHVDAVIALARDVLDPRTDAIVINGDLLDCWLLSSFDHDPVRLFAPGARLQEEIDVARPILAALASCCKTVHVQAGNHERRLDRLVYAHPGLFGLAALELPKLLGAPPNVRFYGYGAQLTIGPVTWVHGDRVISDRAVHLAHLFLLKYLGRNIVFSHHHRDQRMHRTVPDEHSRPHVYGAQGVGHLTRPECHREYVTDPNWQSGALITDYFRGASGKVRFHHHPLLVIDDVLEWDGRLYGRGLVQ